MAVEVISAKSALSCVSIDSMWATAPTACNSILKYSVFSPWDKRNYMKSNIKLYHHMLRFLQSPKLSFPIQAGYQTSSLIRPISGVLSATHWPIHASCVGRNHTLTSTTLGKTYLNDSLATSSTIKFAKTTSVISKEARLAGCESNRATKMGIAALLTKCGSKFSKKY